MAQPSARSGGEGKADQVQDERLSNKRGTHYPSTSLFLHWELSLDKATPNFRRDVLGERWDHVAGQLHARLLSWKVGRMDGAGQLLPVPLSLSFPIHRIDRTECSSQGPCGELSEFKKEIVSEQ